MGAPHVPQTGVARLHRSTPLLVFGAVLCAFVVAIHVIDQGGLTAMADPPYKGYLFYALEIGGVLAAILLITPRAGSSGWVLALGVSIGPASGYILSRSIGLPHYADDVGNWMEPLGVASLVVEGLLFTAALTALIADHRVFAAQLHAVGHQTPSADVAEPTFTPTPIPQPRGHGGAASPTEPGHGQDWGTLQEILAQLDDLAHRVIRLEQTTGLRPAAHRGGLADWVPSGARREGPY